MTSINNSSVAGGNLLIDGNPEGGAIVDLDYPGPMAKRLGKIGADGYVPNHNFGVRITSLPKKQFRLEQLVDMLPQGPALTLKAADLPNGSFGFEFCCGRSFQVDNVVIEVSHRADAEESAKARLAAHADELKRRQSELQAARESWPKLKSDPRGASLGLRIQLPHRPTFSCWLAVTMPSQAPKQNQQPSVRCRKPAIHFAVQPTSTSSGRRSAWARWATNPHSRVAHLMAAFKSIGCGNIILELAWSALQRTWE